MKGPSTISSKVNERYVGCEVDENRLVVCNLSRNAVNQASMIRTVGYTSWTKSQGRKILGNLVVADHRLSTRTCQVSFARNNKSLPSLVLPKFLLLS